MSLRWRWIALLLASAAVAEAAAPASHDDARPRLDLRARRLYAVAEETCQEELRRGQTTPGRQATLVVELLRTWSAWAADSPPDERERLWRKSAEAVRQFAERNPEHPDLSAVQLQGIVDGPLARGELALREAQLTADNTALLEQARGRFNDAVHGLHELAEQLSQQAPKPPPSPRKAKSPLPGAGNRAVQERLQYYLARALRRQAESYRAGSDDFNRGMTAAVRALQPLAASGADAALAWQARVDLVQTRRLLEQRELALRDLDAFARLKPPASAALRFRAERLRWALATEASPPPAAILAEGREIDGQAAVELDLARLEAFLAAWRAADTPQRQSQVHDALTIITQRHPGYGTRLARLRLAEFIAQSPSVTARDLLIVAAEAAYRAGRFDDAIAAYDRARAATEKQAGKPSDRSAQFELAYLAAAIEHQRGRHADALDRFREAARAAPEHARAAEAFALAVHHAAQLARSESATDLARYESLLREHLARWPTSTEGRVIRAQLARLLELKEDWPGPWRCGAPCPPATRSLPRPPTECGGATNGALENGKVRRRLFFSKTIGQKMACYAEA